MQVNPSLLDSFGRLKFHPSVWTVHQQRDRIIVRGKDSAHDSLSVPAKKYGSLESLRADPYSAKAKKFMETLENFFGGF